MLEKLKMLLGIEGAEKDSILNFILDTASEIVKAYCRLDAISIALENIVVKMAADMYRMEGYGQADRPQTVSSESEGSRSISYESSDKNADNLLKNYEKMLSPFINRRGRLPSEV